MRKLRYGDTVGNCYMEIDCSRRYVINLAKLGHARYTVA
jgi:hypothetical protein